MSFVCVWLCVCVCVCVCVLIHLMRPQWIVPQNDWSSIHSLFMEICLTYFHDNIMQNLAWAANSFKKFWRLLFFRFSETLFLHTFLVDIPVCIIQNLFPSPSDFSVLLWVCCITFNLYWNAIKKRRTESFEKWVESLDGYIACLKTWKIKFRYFTWCLMNCTCKSCIVWSA